MSNESLIDNISIKADQLIEKSKMYLSKIYGDVSTEDDDVENVIKLSGSIATIGTAILSAGAITYGVISNNEGVSKLGFIGFGIANPIILGATIVSYVSYGGIKRVIENHVNDWKNNNEFSLSGKYKVLNNDNEWVKVSRLSVLKDVDNGVFFKKYKLLDNEGSESRAIKSYNVTMDNVLTSVYFDNKDRLIKPSIRKDKLLENFYRVMFTNENNFIKTKQYFSKMTNLENKNLLNTGKEEVSALNETVSVIDVGVSIDSLDSKILNVRKDSITSTTELGKKRAINNK